MNTVTTEPIAGGFRATVTNGRTTLTAEGPTEVDALKALKTQVLRATSQPRIEFRDWETGTHNAAISCRRQRVLIDCRCQDSGQAVLRKGNE